MNARLTAVKNPDSEARAHTMNVEDVVAWEQRIEANGTSLLELMTRAGNAVADLAERMLVQRNADMGASYVVVLAGSGNNGGDGWVAAQRLAAEGHNVTLVTKSAAEELTAEPARTAALRANSKCNFRVVVSPEKGDLTRLLDEADVVVDAMLGTGFSHAEVRAPYDTWIELANAVCVKGTPVLAVDCPSGLNAQTGDAASSCIRASATVTMLAVKPGLLGESARQFVGSLYLASLGMEREQ